MDTRDEIQAERISAAALRLRRAIKLVDLHRAPILYPHLDLLRAEQQGTIDLPMPWLLAVVAHVVRLRRPRNFS